MVETDTGAARPKLEARDAEALLYDYASCIDQGEMERWPTLFARAGSYELVPAENDAGGLPVALMFCRDRAMIEDRATAIMHANIYSPHTYRHLYGNLRVTVGADSAILQCNYAVYRTDQEGVSDCFSVGRVEATVVVEEGSLRFARMRVVYDTATVRGLLVLPI